MYLEKVKIKNFRGIKDLELNLTPGVNLIIGDNGTGKSSTLKAIRTGLSGMFRELPGVLTRGIYNDDRRVEVNTNNSVSRELRYIGPVSVESTIRIEEDGSASDRVFSWERYRDIYLTARTNMSDTSVSKYLMNISNEDKSPLPILFYQNDKRGSENNSRANTDKDLIKDRRAGYVRALEGVTDIQKIRGWALLMEMTSFQRRMEIPGYIMFKDIVSTFMMKINGSQKKVDIFYDATCEDFIYEEGDEEIPIDKLSAGYQALVWTIMDIAYRAVTLNPSYRGDFRNLPGIILLDEIDMHLHPKWQWNIVKALTETFPKVQFILTTHSPIIISSCKHANIIPLGEQDLYLDGAYGKNVQDVLEFVMGSEGRPADIQKILNNFEEYLCNDDFENADIELEKLKEKLTSNHPDYQAAKEKLEMYRWVGAN